MDQTLKPIRFSHHALALTSSCAMVGTIFSALALIVIASIYIFTGKAIPQEVLILVPLLWFTITALMFGIMIVPFTIAWPVTRTGSNVSVFICALIGTMSTFYAFLIFPSNGQSYSLSSIVIWLFFGALWGVIYMALAQRFHRRSNASEPVNPKNKAMTEVAFEPRQAVMEL
jgi:hypothetical protein